MPKVAVPLGNDQQGLEQIYARLDELSKRADSLRQSQEIPQETRKELGAIYKNWVLMYNRSTEVGACASALEAILQNALKNPLLKAFHIRFLNDRIRRFDSFYKLNPKSLIKRTREDFSAERFYRDEVAHLRKTNRDQELEISRLQDLLREKALEIAALETNRSAGNEAGKIDISDIVDPDRDPETYELVSRLMQMEEDERQAELEKIFQQQIPVFLGVRQEGCRGLEFLDKHWGLWIKLGLASRSQIVTFSGSGLARQVDKEIDRLNLDRDKIFPSKWTISRTRCIDVTDDVRRAVWNLEKKRLKTKR